MAQTALLLLGILRAVIEVALLALLGQGLLFVLAGSRRDANPIYVFFRTITAPAIRVVRRLTPQADHRQACAGRQRVPAVLAVDFSRLDQAFPGRLKNSRRDAKRWR